MFVLTRGIGQKINIGTGSVEILRINGRKAVFGFKYPDDVMIFRSKLSDEKRQTLTEELKAQVAAGLKSNGVLVLTAVEGESFDIADEFVLTLSQVRVGLGKVEISIDALRPAPELRT